MKTLEFRDGIKAVPDHIAEFLDEAETYKITYWEAIDRMNQRFLTDKLAKVQSGVVSDHLARFRE